MATEKRLIDANAFKMFLEVVRQDYLEEDTFSSDFAAQVIETVQDEYLSNAPTVDAVEVVHGRFEFACVHNGKKHYKCTNCHHAFPFANVNYCPNCGAKMEVESQCQTK